MKRTRRPADKPLLTDVLAQIALIADLEDRAKACCEAGLIGDNPRSRAMLQTCCQGNGFYATQARTRLETVQRPRKVRKPKPYKPWVAPVRMPSLFDTKSETGKA